MQTPKTVQALLAAVLLAVLPLVTAAVEEPEAVYAKFHQAGLTGDMNAMIKYGTAAKGAEMQSMPAPMRDGMLGMLALMLPKTYAVDGKTIDPDGKHATLHLSTKVEAKRGGAPATAYGTATLVKENGAWKVDEAKWGGPPEAGAPQPAAQAPAAPAPVMNGNAQGMVHGVKFKVESAALSGTILELRQGTGFFPDYAFKIFLFPKMGAAVDGATFSATAEGFGNPHVHLKYKVEGSGVPNTEIFTDKYQMTLSFQTRTGKKIKGAVDLHLPDAAKSFVTGTFEANIE